MSILTNRMKFSLLWCLLFGLVTDAGVAQRSAITSNEWKGLVPLHSTRADVERLLGVPTLSYGSVYRYETKNDLADILFSAGACELSGVEKWNVPSNVIISMQVAPKGNISFDSLHLDRKKYFRFREAHPDNWVQYWNE